MRGILRRWRAATSKAVQDGVPGARSVSDFLISCNIIQTTLLLLCCCYCCCCCWNIVLSVDQLYWALRWWVHRAWETVLGGWSQVQYFSVLYSTFEYFTVFYSTFQYFEEMYFSVLLNTVQYCTVLLNTVQYCSVLLNNLQNLTVH